MRDCLYGSTRCGYCDDFDLDHAMTKLVSKGWKGGCVVGFNIGGGVLIRTEEGVSDAQCV